MNQKRMYMFGLVGLFLIWASFGFRAPAPGREVVLQSTLPPVDVTPVAPQATNSAAIPVTGEPEPVWTEILVFYGLIGLTALFLILALLNLANKSTVQHVQPKSPSSAEMHKK